MTKRKPDRMPMDKIADGAKHHMGAATFLETESASVRTALRRSAELNDLHDTISSAIKGTCDQYAEYMMFRAKVDQHWAKHPEDYDEAIHDQIEDVDESLFGVFRTLVSVLDRLEKDGAVPEDAEKVRKTYAKMLSIELMDHGPLPEHMENLTNRAIDSYRNGQVSA